MLNHSYQTPSRHYIMADSRFAPSQWETSLQSNTVPPRKSRISPVHCYWKQTIFLVCVFSPPVPGRLHLVWEQGLQVSTRTLRPTQRLPRSTPGAHLPRKQWVVVFLWHITTACIRNHKLGSLYGSLSVETHMFVPHTCLLYTLLLCKSPTSSFE